TLSGGWLGFSSRARGIWWPGTVDADICRGNRDVGRREPLVRNVPRAHSWRSRSTESARDRATHRYLRVLPRERRMGDRNVPHRTAGGLGPFDTSDPGRAGWRLLASVWTEDLHLVGRSRHDGQHRALRARAD